MPRRGPPLKPNVAPSCMGGRTQFDHFGYVIEYAPDHPAVTLRGFVRQHRLVMEKVLGRYLSGMEVVHHIDRNRMNNDPSNLMVMSDQEHKILHGKEDDHSANLPEETVRAALLGRTTLEAAAFLGVHHQTLRNRFPHLLQLRRSPCDPYSPETEAAVRVAAADSSVGYQQFASDTGISSQVAKAICDRLGIVWIRKRTTPIQSSSKSDDSLDGPVIQ